MSRTATGSGFREGQLLTFAKVHGIEPGDDSLEALDEDELTGLARLLLEARQAVRKRPSP